MSANERSNKKTTATSLVESTNNWVRSLSLVHRCLCVTAKESVFANSGAKSGDVMGKKIVHPFQGISGRLSTVDSGDFSKVPRNQKRPENVDV